MSEVSSTFFCKLPASNAKRASKAVLTCEIKKVVQNMMFQFTLHVTTSETEIQQFKALQSFPTLV